MNMPKINLPQIEISTRAKFISIFVGGLGGICFVLWLGIVSAERTNQFFDTHYFAFHKVLEIKTSFPLTIEKRDPIVVYVPVVTDLKKIENSKQLTYEEKVELVKKSDYPKILTGIWTLETTRGKGRNDNDPTNHQSNCAKAGMSNEFGYDPAHGTCFASFAESVEIINRYIDENINKMSMNQLLCFYNIGKAVDTCSYAVNFHALDSQGKLALK